jgi:uncharacterized phage protein gp47/JayE
MALSSELLLPSAASLKSQVVEDLQLQALDAGVATPPIEPGGEWDLISTGDANIASVLLANLQILDEDSDPLRATGAALDEWRQRLSLPEVLASAASGQLTIVVDGTATIPAGLQLQAPNGFRARVPLGYVGVTGSILVDAAMIDTGTDGNLLAGTKVQVIGGPPNIRTEATVPADWTGGKPAEDDTRKRERIISRMRNGGSGWGDLRSTALDASGAISDCYIYPALGGPGSVKAIVLSNTSKTTRAVGVTTVAAVQSFIDNAFPKDIWNCVVQSVVDRPADVSVAIQLPARGMGKWLASGPIAPAYVSSIISETSFSLSGSVGALSINELIACWDATTATFSTATVLGISGTAVVTTPWSGGEGPSLNSQISPACENLDGIAAAFVAQMLRLGPGEQVASTNPRFVFAYRHPVASSDYPMTCGSALLLAVQQAYPQIINISYIGTPSPPVPPALVSSASEVLQLNRFGVYPL